jgi:2-succinyl-6-hydroxy-2,4-cyclohexadiene-1-carboxylate synthase
MAEQMIQLDERAWYASVQGRGHPILMLHGFTGSADSWIDVAKALANRFQCIAVDITGHGRTSAPMDISAYTMENVCADLLQVMSKLGHDKFHVLGYSMGGRLALCLALTAPWRVLSLCLESASPGLQTEQERALRRASDERLADEIEQYGVEVFVKKWEQLPLFATQARLPESVRLAQRNIRLSQRKVGLANSLRGMGTGVQPNLWGRLGELNMPVLLVTGALDEKFCHIAERMLREMPVGRHITIADAGHTVHMEQTAAYVDAVAAFFAQSERGEV